MPTAIINSLPTELLDYIIELACSDNEGAWEAARTRRARGSTFALVARRWRWKAQSLVWHKVSIRSREKAESFCGSGARGRHPTRSLSLEPREFAGCKKVLRACHGVESLSLKDGRFAGTALASPMLAGLKELHLDNADIIKPLPRKFGFQLTKLSIIALPRSSEEYSEDFLALLAEATNQRLETFTLAWQGRADEKLLRSLQPSAPHLQDLLLPIFDPDHAPAAISFLRAAATLTELVLSDFHPSAFHILSAIPPTLTSLALEIDTYEDEGCIVNSSLLDAIRRGMSAAPKLRSLCLGRGEVADWDCLGGWLELVEECARKQVELKFDSGPVDLEIYLARSTT